jgi:hypothetical protein
LKNKKLTYLLICSVLAVWGIIVYRVFARSAGDQKEYESSPAQKAPEEPLDDYELKDNFTLNLNYRDPFSGTGSTETEQTAPPDFLTEQIPVFNNLPASPPPIDWSFIRYAGRVVNPASRKTITLLIINSLETMIGEGEQIRGVKLIKNYRDSVKVSFQGKEKFIRLK